MNGKDFIKNLDDFFDYSNISPVFNFREYGGQFCQSVFNYRATTVCIIYAQEEIRIRIQGVKKMNKTIGWVDIDWTNENLMKEINIMIDRIESVS